MLKLYQMLKEEDENSGKWVLPIRNSQYGLGLILVLSVKIGSFLVVKADHGLTLRTNMVIISGPSCLSLLSVGVTGGPHLHVMCLCSYLKLLGIP